MKKITKEQKGMSLLEFVLATLIIVLLIFIINNVINGKYIEIKIDEKATLGTDLEITVDSNRISNKVNPMHAMNSYTYYQAEDNKKYIDIVIDVENLTDEDVRYDDLFNAKVKIGGHKYKTIVVAENEKGTDFVEQANLYAGKTTRYHIAAEIEEDILKENEKIEFFFKIKNKKYKYKYSIDLKNDDSINDAKVAELNINYTGQEVEKGETITVPGSCEFKITSAEFKKQVNPPLLSSTYNYFPAGEGKMYLDLIIEVKNTQQNEVKQNQLMGSINLIYNNENEFSFSKVAEMNGGRDLNENVDYYSVISQETIIYHMLCEVPEEIQTSRESLEVDFFIDGYSYKYIIR